MTETLTIRMPFNKNEERNLHIVHFIISGVFSLPEKQKAFGNQ